jgi:hypothetical protein
MVLFLLGSIRAFVPREDDAPLERGATRAPPSIKWAKPLRWKTEATFEEPPLDALFAQNVETLDIVTDHDLRRKLPRQ